MYVLCSLTNIFNCLFFCVWHKICLLCIPLCNIKLIIELHQNKIAPSTFPITNNNYKNRTNYVATIATYVNEHINFKVCRCCTKVSAFFRENLSMIECGSFFFILFFKNVSIINHNCNA